VIGVLIRADSPSDTCTAYADQHKFRVGDFLLIPVGYGGMVNHSQTPNLKKCIEGHRVYLQAMRTIHPGEELFFRYPDSALLRFGLMESAMG
jgi:SET domain-containing protein